MKTLRDPRIDAYIAKSAPFAQPILRHLRGLVHRGCPGAEETIKWRMPAFTHQGILCLMAGFKAHCTFGFWHHGMKQILEGAEGPAGSAMGHFGRITRREDLPDDKTLLGFIQHAAKLNQSGAPTRVERKTKKPAVVSVPDDFAGGLRKNKLAAKSFQAFSPSQRRDYVEWITEAKRPETREKRLATTLLWLSEGKSRNWKYENC